MGIDRESDIAASLQVGPTSLGMVRVHVATESVELPLDFEPDEAEEIAEELVAAAARARSMRAAAGGRGAGGPGGDGRRARKGRRGKDHGAGPRPGSGSQA